MSVEVHTVHRPSIQARKTRPHDYLYDPLCIIPAKRDVSKAALRALFSTAKLRCEPNYPTMFSELPHYPAYTWDLRPEQPRPVKASHRIRTRDLPPEDPDVTGKNRYKYFRRAVIPLLSRLGGAGVGLRLASERPRSSTAIVVQRQEDKGLEVQYVHRTIATQTDYRESEAQTDPYSPPFVVRGKGRPEVLTLAVLSWGHGLPAGKDEVDMIERLRAKRQWEAELPPIDDPQKLDKRVRLVAEMERQEWQQREEEIEKIQGLRLELLEKLRAEQEEKRKDRVAGRLDNRWEKLTEEKERRVKKIHVDHARGLRRLQRRRNKVNCKFVRRDVIGDYADCGSHVYAPLARLGGDIADFRKNPRKMELEYLEDFRELAELEGRGEGAMVRPKVKLPPGLVRKKVEGYSRKLKVDRELQQLHELIKEEKARVPTSPPPLKYLEVIEQPRPRLPTPSVEPWDRDEEERHQAILLLQKLIRGRAIQNKMLRGEAHRHDLITELRGTHALQESQLAIKQQLKEDTIHTQQYHRTMLREEQTADELVSRVAGALVGRELDFLSKELVRLQEERRIQALVMLAERERSRREAAEAGRRQAEERRRREMDEMFKQVVKVDQLTVDSYLEDIVLETVEKSSEEEARKYVQDLAVQLNDVVYELARSDNWRTDEMVAELIHSFVIPEAHKSVVRERLQLQQQRHLLAARDTMNQLLGKPDEKEKKHQQK